MIKLLQGDCLELMKDIPDSSIDLVVSDVPYHIISGGCTNNAVYFKSMPSGMLSRTNIYAKQGKIFKYNDIEFHEWLPSVYRVLKDNSHCYLMVNGRNLKDLQTEAEKVGFKYQNLLVWDKGNCTPTRYYMNACEFILFLRKGNAKNINNLGSKTIIRVPNVRNKTHPTEKPVDLMKILIENSSNENDIVLDPFMGSGSIGISCKRLNRNFIGIELDKNYFDVAKERIENENTNTDHNAD